MVVQSSKGKFHVYWRVVDCDVEKFSVMQRSLALKFNGDPAMKNLDRVMRLPGFPHQKGEPEPVIVLMNPRQSPFKMKLIYQKAQAAVTIMSPKIAQTAGTPALETDVFGLDLSPRHELPDVIKKGYTVTSLVAEVGHQIAQGFSRPYVKAEIEKLNQIRCEQPLSKDRLEREVLGCVDKFYDNLKEERAERAAIPKPPRKPLAERHPPAPPAPELVIPGEAPPPPPEGGNSLEEWLSRFRFVEEQSRVIDSTKKGTYAEYTLSEFKNKYANIYVGRDSKLCNKWFHHPKRKDVRDTIFFPTKAAEVTQYGEKFWNTYAPSDLNPVDKADPVKIEPFMAHLEYMFPKKSERRIFLNWMAMTVQHPEIKIPWAPLIISKQGVGKGFIFKVLTAILGMHNCSMILPERLDNQFNAFLQDNVLTCIDEMKHGSKVDVSDKLKSYISETSLEINVKGKKERTREVFGNFIIFTNHSNATFIDEGDRRFWVYNIKALKNTPEYYDQLWAWYRKEPQSLNHLMRYLLDIDLSKYDHATVPKSTLAKIEMIQANKSGIEMSVLDAVANRDGIFAADIIGYQTFKDYIAQTEGVISSASEGNLRKLFGKLFETVDHAMGGIIPFQVPKGIRQRVRSVRNHEYWHKANRHDLRYELARSVQLGASGSTVLPPKLTIVNNKVASED